MHAFVGDGVTYFCTGAKPLAAGASARPFNQRGELARCILAACVLSVPVKPEPNEVVWGFHMWFSTMNPVT